MEFRWHLLPGQTLENTKIADRKAELHVTAKAWKNITKHLDRKRLAEEAIKKEQDRRKAMKEESQAMVDQWDNSIINIFHRKQEEAIRRAEKSQKEKMESFLLIQKEQEVVRQKYIDEMRENMYRKVGFPKEIDGALLFAEVLREREKQLEFKEMLRQKERDQEAEHAAKVKQGVIDEAKENEDKMRKRREKNIAYSNLYLKEMQEKREKAEIDRKLEMEAEAVDIQNSLKAIKDIERIRREEAKEYKKQLEEQTESVLNKLKEKLMVEGHEEADKDRIIAIQAAANHRMECLKKHKKKEMEAKMNARREAASKMATQRAQELAKEEQRLLEKAEAAKEKEALEKIQAKIEKAKKAKEEGIENRRQAVEKYERQRAEEEEMKKWDMLNRYKINEYAKMHDSERKREKWGSILNHRQALLQQMAEKEQILKDAEIKDDEMHKAELAALDAADKKFFNYADKVLEIVKSRGHTTVPLERVVEKYKKINMLEKPEKRCSRSKGVPQSRPGKMTHDPKSDPNYNKNNADMLFK